MPSSSSLAARLNESLSWDHEKVCLIQDRDIGLHAVVAIHSTVLGPALGGMRVRGYAGGVPDALDDALRLSRAMTLKASAAGLQLGGGKAVVIDDGRDDLRRARLSRLAAEIDRLDGAYITAEDIGTTTEDMGLVSKYTSHVVGCPGGRDGGDPSPDTARTVLGAIRAAISLLDGDESLAGRRVGVIGAGKVGGQLIEWLVENGAVVTAYDPSPAAVSRMEALGAGVARSAEEVLEAELDVLSPCAAGGAIDADSVSRLRARVVCGAANNPLSGSETPRLLAERGVLYVPDFLANSGGLIHADAERRDDLQKDRLDEAILDARRRVEAVLEEALRLEQLPSAVAEEHALARIADSRSPAAPTRS